MAFLLLVLGVLVGVHCYLWHRLVRATTRPGVARRRLTWVAAGLFALVVITFAGMRVPWLSWLAWPGYMWIAIMFYLFWILLALEVPRAVAGVVLRAGKPVREPVKEPAKVPVGGPPEPEPPAGVPADPGRRLFLGRATALVAGVGALSTVGYGVTRALGDPVIERASVTLPGLDSRLSGLRFAVVSDIHLGPLTGKAHAERIVRMINGLEADVVAIVGDMVDGTVEALGPLARPLRELESRYGAYFVTGNHEYYTANGPDEWVEELSDLGVRSLRNERVEIRHQGAVLDLAGVNDVTGATAGDGPDFAAALGGRDESRSVVLLAHQPVQVAEAARHGVDLQLSGHTHGGQMVPFNLIVPMQQPVVSGLATVDGVRVYVTRGAGFWGPPVRVGAPPEITLLEIR
ncbi:metallophosphoesterase [Nonomuraea sp. NPDC048826]|uniref:metallophosphoesterase n=1 Tax=Nonomuraea sp. NPDC048826 TaxID=3364347 RepID=UPI003713BE78